MNCAICGCEADEHDSDDFGGGCGGCGDCPGYEDGYEDADLDDEAATP